MENLERGLNITQACESAPKIKENKQFEAGQMENEAAIRFGRLSLGCFIYAIIYTFCMYRNKEGITFPFFIGVTLYFFYYFTKKYGVTAAKSNRFLVISIVILGILTCTTASGVIIFLNKTLILFLLCILLLKTYFDVSKWNIANYLCSTLHVAGGSFVRMFAPLADGFSFLRFRYKNSEKKGLSEQTRNRIFAIAAGLVVAIPMVFIILLLLCRADVYFSGLFDTMFNFVFDYEFELAKIIREVVKIGVTIVIFFAFSYGVVTYINGKNGIWELVHQKRTQWDAFTAITFCSLIGIIYVVFAWVQITGLFMRKLTLPYGYSYAEYAREGFFQLVFVCLFNVVLVLVCMHCFRQHKVLQVLLTIISVCTYVMLVSSAYRMLMYIDVYKLTFLRFFVLWGIFVIGMVMMGVIAAIFKQEFPVFSYILVTVTTLYIAFVVIHPDYVVARYNIAQKEVGKEIDEWYLREDLSLDAAGLVIKMYEKELQDEELLAEYVAGETYIPETILDYYNRVMGRTDDMNLRTFNISKGLARMQVEAFAKREEETLEWIKQIEEERYEYYAY